MYAYAKVVTIKVVISVWNAIILAWNVHQRLSVYHANQ